MAKYDHEDLRDKSPRPDPKWLMQPPPTGPYSGPTPSEDTEPMLVLQECLDLMRRKAHDYQNPNSEVKQADYYPHGLITLMDIIHAKQLRLKSLIEAYQAGAAPKNESIEDSFKDMANYCAIAAAWCRGKIDGQAVDRDLIGRKVR
jgi:hypothetical protein